MAYTSVCVIKPKILVSTCVSANLYVLSRISGESPSSPRLNDCHAIRQECNRVSFEIIYGTVGAFTRFAERSTSRHTKSNENSKHGMFSSALVATVKRRSRMRSPSRLRMVRHTLACGQAKIGLHKLGRRQGAFYKPFMVSWKACMDLPSDTVITWEDLCYA